MIKFFIYFSLALASSFTAGESLYADDYIDLTSQLVECDQIDDSKNCEIDDPEALVENLSINLSEKPTDTPPSRQPNSCSHTTTSFTCIRAPPLSR